jgi:hypothetical protein
MQMQQSTSYDIHSLLLDSHYLILIYLAKRLDGTGSGDGDLGLGLCLVSFHELQIQLARLTSGVGTLSLDLPDEVLSLGDFTEDDVLTVQPGGNDGGDEELGSVGVGSSVGHGEQEGLVVPQLEVLISELVSVDGLSTGTVVVGELIVSKIEVNRS